MRILDEFLRRESAQCVKNGVRGERLSDGVTASLPCSSQAFAPSSRRPHGARRLHVRLAIDYSGRDAILYAVECAIRSGQSSREHFAWAVRSGRGEPAHVPDVDFLIRTGGERRLSDFLLW